MSAVGRQFGTETCMWIIWEEPREKNLPRFKIQKMKRRKLSFFFFTVTHAHSLTDYNCKNNAAAHDGKKDL